MKYSTQLKYFYARIHGFSAVSERLNAVCSESFHRKSVWQCTLIQDEIEVAMQDIFSVLPTDKFITSWRDIKPRTIVN